MLSGKRLFWWAALAVAVLVAGCVKQDTKALIIVKGGRNVHYANVGGHKQVRYELKQAYPAKAALKEISDRLAKLGYQPLKDDYFNKGLPSSHVRGWTFFSDATKTPEEDVEQWLAQWRNANGNVVGYSLQYRSPSGGPGNKNHLLVYGMLIR